MIPILYQDEACLAVCKPAGMLIHRSAIDRRETVFLMQTLREQIGGHVYPVHRLDRPTSGVVLFARDSEAARLLTAQFERREVEKVYWAVVRGWPPERGRIDHPLKTLADPLGEPWADPDKAAQAARTDYRTLARAELPFASHPRHPTSRYAWLEVRPHTGRQHQIRRHLKHIFHPIVGDTTHGDLRQNHAVAAFCGNRRLLLHARALSFRSPQKPDCRITAQAEPDAAWRQVVRAFGWPEVPAAEQAA
ncbi:MAG: pseudouridine synthase [Eikenella sp.]|nr:pseudouridine synthase [Eikenella sp.]